MTVTHVPVAPPGIADEYAYSQFLLSSPAEEKQADAMEHTEAVLFLVVGADVTRSHFCHPTKGILKWCFAHLMIDSALVSLSTKKVHLCITTHSDTHLDDATKTSERKYVWFYVGVYQGHRQTWSSVKGCSRRHVLVTHEFKPARWNEPKREVFLEHSAIDPFLNCPINRYGASLCDPGQCLKVSSLDSE
jgi:hypothetical protein